MFLVADMFWQHAEKTASGWEAESEHFSLHRAWHMKLLFYAKCCPT